MTNEVPFLDLVTPHRDLEQELLAVVQDALRTGRFIGGPAVENFEREFARFCGSPQCIGVGSGTDALRFALMAAGVRPGDAVITVPLTFIATAEAITQANALPLFVDVHPVTLTLDPLKLREFLSQQCKVDAGGRCIHVQSGRPITAVVPVHLYGLMADMNAIMAVAGEYRLPVIEDACQAHGALCRDDATGQWRKAGTFGKAAAFSFYPGKNLGACGEAGAVTTADEALAARVRMLRDHGQIEKYVHPIEGYNGRLDSIQAGMLSVKLRHLPKWNEQRRRCAHRYNQLLGGIAGIGLPHEPEWARSVYHVYAVRTADRHGLQQFLAAQKVATGMHYPIPLHLQQAYAQLGHAPGSFPVSERAARAVLSLPMFPGMTEEQQVQVAESVQAFIVAGLSRAPQREAAALHPAPARGDHDPAI